eukprot:3643320-Pyramimonas_sp.AAC.1
MGFSGSIRKEKEKPGAYSRTRNSTSNRRSQNFVVQGKLVPLRSRPAGHPPGPFRRSHDSGKKLLV